MTRTVMIKKAKNDNYNIEFNSIKALWFWQWVGFDNEIYMLSDSDLTITLKKLEIG